ncbi:putative LRR receptor-like serine/threonine-protein kinase [Acorus calamus]|uniref:non-specific serine/threonine protein kinase n=1 Tax=Acorus calamus TaxID=4465 RepID=A0AAV9CLX1_ACOCL|nr:putative LRR receptor-like serine/threonine-protein kinase [Acorus calamus]
MVVYYSLLVLFLQLITSVFCQVREFVSIDCGGKGDYTDTSTGLTWISDAGLIRYGNISAISSTDPDPLQYRGYRYFPADSKKYCYSLSTVERRRYIVRATFLYGETDINDPYPKFELYLDATHWSTVTINYPTETYVEEMIIRATSTSINVCLCCASTGYPFISTLELRPLNGSMYATDFEEEFFLSVAARVNFGALSKDNIRYPNDPYDRIWESDLDKRQNFLVGMAPGTIRINTTKNVKTDMRECPPVKVMQTAIVGTQGSLSYRLNLYGFPANARAYAYLAEIEDLGWNESRKFTMQKPYVPDYSNAVVNIAENANGSYTLYEPSYMNVSLDFVLSCSFVKTHDSTRGPLINAIEISRYVPIVPKTSGQDASVLDMFRTMSIQSDWASEEGDPCIPTQWEWVKCSSSKPPRITKIDLSGRDLNGTIPSQLKLVEGLTELWLNDNSLAGSIPDMSNLKYLTILHLENNRLTGQLPSYLGDMPNLRELYVQNNNLSGGIPPTLLTKKLIFKYDGNPGLICREQKAKRLKLIIGIITGVLAIFILFLSCPLMLRHLRRRPLHEESSRKCDSIRATSKPSNSYSVLRVGSLITDEGLDVTNYMPLSELVEATHNFSKKIGKGSFGPVYYGKLKDGKEVAVKIKADISSHGTKQFENEVSLLSRIHHKNLVPLIGYCEEGNQSILVYEYMHNGTLRDHIHDNVNHKHLDWLSRLQIAEDAARGLEYLHSGCNPSIIHRDVKTTNILLDINMRAKMSDFGLSKQTDENFTHVSSVAQGTVGYLDPEYYATQQLSEKSDVYSFGVVLLELISGRKPVSVEDYGTEWNIVHWARSLINKGDITSIIDPSLENFKIESVWRIAEVAISSVHPYGASRPRMQEIELAIQDAIKIEKRSKAEAQARHLHILPHCMHRRTCIHCRTPTQS